VEIVPDITTKTNNVENGSDGISGLISYNNIICHCVVILTLEFERHKKYVVFNIQRYINSRYLKKFDCCEILQFSISYIKAIAYNMCTSAKVKYEYHREDIHHSNLSVCTLRNCNSPVKKKHNHALVK